MDNRVNGQVPPTKNSESDIKQHSSKRADTGYRITPFLYEQGFTNGVLKVNTDPFPDYISGNYKKKHASARLNIVDENIKKLEHYITQITSQKIGLEKIISTSKYTIENLERVIANAVEKRDRIYIKINDLKDERSKISFYYNLVVATLFIVVGIVFIGAEVMITHDVLYNVLAIEHWKSYPLAIAIALVSISLKPAVDRVFEEPYLAGRQINMKILLLLVSILALVMLGFLGYFRNVGEVILNNPELIESGIQPFEHWASITVFTLSSILFALSGAISFSIGFPVFNFLIKKRNIRRTTERLQKELLNLEKSIDQHYQEITQHKIEGETASVYLKMMPDTKELEADLELLQTEKSEELALYYEYKEQMEQAWYQTGLQRGKEYQLNGKLLVNPLDVNNIFDPGETSEDDNGKIVVMHGQGGKYLHERIRNMIQYNFNRNQKIWNDK